MYICLEAHIYYKLMSSSTTAIIMIISQVLYRIITSVNLFLGGSFSKINFIIDRVHPLMLPYVREYQEYWNKSNKNSCVYLHMPILYYLYYSISAVRIYCWVRKLSIHLSSVIGITSNVIHYSKDWTGQCPMDISTKPICTITCAFVYCVLCTFTVPVHHIVYNVHCTLRIEH